MSAVDKHERHRLIGSKILILQCAAFFADVTYAQRPYWVKLSINASNTIIGAESEITIIMSATALIAAGTDVTVSGMHGSLTTDSASLPLTGPSASVWTARSGAWSSKAGLLVLTAVKDLQAFCEFVFSFRLINPAVQTSGSKAQFSVSDPFLSGFASGLALVGLNSPNWTVVPSVSESSNVINMTNILTFQMGLDVPIYGGSAFTVSGLIGAKSPSLCNFSRMCIFGKSGSVFSVGGLWDDSGVFTLTVASDVIVPAGEIVQFEIQIMNPDKSSGACSAVNTICEQQAVHQLRIDAKIFPTAIFNAVRLLNLVYGEVLGSTESYSFLTRSIFENNSFTLGNSILYFRLVPNFIIATGSIITITGLKGSGEFCAECTLPLDSLSETTALATHPVFAFPSSALTLSVRARVEIGQLLSFGVSIRNGAQEQTPVVPKLSASGPTGNCQPQQMLGSVLGSSSLPSVFGAVVTESTTIQGSTNELNFYFNPSVDLDAGSTIIITGLNNSLTDSGAVLVDGQRVVSYGIGSPVAIDDWPTAVWDRILGTLSIRPLTPVKSLPDAYWRNCSLACIHRFAVTLLNPARPQVHDGIFIAVVINWIQVWTPPIPLAGGQQVFLAQTPSRVLTATISESSNAPSRNNTICMSFSFQGAFPAGSIFTITGLIGSQTPSTSYLPIFGDLAGVIENPDIGSSGSRQLEEGPCSSSGGDSSVPPTGVFYSQEGVLYVKVCDTLAPASTNSLCFVIVNSQQPQAPQIPQLSSDGAVFYSSTAMQVSSESPDPRGILSAAYVPSFTNLAITETSKVNGAVNYIQVFFRTNFVLTINQTIWISGLLDSTSGDSDMMPLYGDDSAVFGSFGKWTQTNGTLSLQVKVRSAKMADRVISFGLWNPLRKSPLRMITISAYSPVYVRPTPFPDSILGAGIPAYFLYADVEESSNVPSAPNNVTFTLSPSVNLDAGIDIILAGMCWGDEEAFLPMEDNVGSYLPVLGSGKGLVEGGAAFFDGLCTLILTLSTLMKPFCQYQFTFSLINTAQSQEAPDISISTDGNVPITAVLVNGTILTASGQAALINLHVHQSNDVQKEQNNITIAFQANTILPQDESIFIGPFTNIQFPTQYVPLFGPTAYIFKACGSNSNVASGTGMWNQSSHNLCISLANGWQAFEKIALVITVENPQNPQPPVKMTVAASGPLHIRNASSPQDLILGAAEICKFSLASAAGVCSISSCKLLLSFQTNCFIPVSSNLNLFGICPDCVDSGILYLSTSSQLSPLFDMDNITDIDHLEFQLTSSWYPGTWANISLSYDMTLSQLNSLDVQAEIVTLTENLQLAGGYCSIHNPCVDRASLGPSIVQFNDFWETAAFQISSSTNIDSTRTIQIFLTPVLNLPKNTNITLRNLGLLVSAGDIVPISGRDRLLWRNAVASKGNTDLVLTLANNVTAHCSIQFEITLSYAQCLSFQSQLEVAIAPPELDPFELLIQELKCRGNDDCNLNMSSPNITLAASGLSYIPGQMDLLELFFRPNATIPETAVIFLSGFQGLYPRSQILPVLVSVPSSANAFASFSLEASAISVEFKKVLYEGQEAHALIGLTGLVPKVCGTVTDTLITPTLTVSNSGSKTGQIPLQRAVSICRGQVSFLNASLTQATSITDLQNFFLLEFMLNDYVMPGESIFIHGFCGTVQQNLSLRISGQDAQSFFPSAAWIPQQCKASIVMAQTLSKQSWYRINLELLYPPLDEKYFISTERSVHPVPLTVKLMNVSTGASTLGSAACNDDNAVHGAVNNVTCTFYPSFSLPGQTKIVMSGFSKAILSPFGSGAVPVVFDFGKGPLLDDVGATHNAGTVTFQTCDDCIISSQLGAVITFAFKNSYVSSAGIAEIYLSVSSPYFQTIPLEVIRNGTNAILKSSEPAVFKFAEAYESSKVNGALTMLTVRLKPNAVLVAGTYLTVSGLTGSQTQSTSALAVFGPQSQIFSNSGGWDQCVGQLVLKVQGGYTIQSNVVSSFSFWLRNNVNAQDCPAISIASSGPDPTRHVIIPFADIQGRVLGGGQIPTIVSALALEDNSVQDEGNLVTFFLSLNFVVMEMTRITIEGLIGTLTVSTSNLTISGPDGGLFEPQTASWNQGSGTLVLTIAQNILVGEGCTSIFSAQFRNGLTCQSPLYSTFYVEETALTGGSIQALLVARGLLFSSCTEKPSGRVSISQESSVLGSLNTITISMVPNTNIPANLNVTFSGFIGSGTLSTDVSYVTNCRSAWDFGSCELTTDVTKAQWGRIELVNPLPLRGRDAQKFAIQCFYDALAPAAAQCEWQSIAQGIFGQCGGVLVVRTKEPLRAGELFSFSFDLINPEYFSEGVLVTFSSPVLSEPILSSRVLSVDTLPIWLSSSITGSSVTFGDENELYVELVSNAAMPSGQTLLISGLNGSGTPSGNVILSTADSSLLNLLAQWDQSGGVLTVVFAQATYSNLQIGFSFIILNPSGLQDGLNPTLSTFPSPTIDPVAFGSVSRVLEAKSAFFWKQCDIFGLTDVAGANNVAAVDIWPSTLLRGGSKIILTGFHFLPQNSTIAIAAQGLSVFSNISFDPCVGTISVTVKSSVDSDHSTFLPLAFVNPTEQFNSSGISILLMNDYLNATAFHRHCSGSISVTAQKASFTTASISRSLQTVGIPDQILIMFRPSVTMQEQSTISVIGFNVPCTSVGSTANIVTEGASPVSTNLICISSSQQLQLNLPKGLNLETGLNWTFAFEVTNISSFQQSHALSIAATGPYGLVFPAQALAGSIQVSISPAWSELLIQEQTGVPSSLNTITIFIRSNIGISKGILITLSGFVGIEVIQTNGTAPLIDADNVTWKKNSAAFDSCAGNIVVQLNRSAEANERLKLQFDVKNSAMSQTAPRMSILESSRTMPEYISPSSNMLMFSDVPAFTVKAISESSRYQGALNMLTVQIKTNFRIIKDSTVAIFDLEGTARTDREISISGTDSAWFDPQAWEADTGTLSLSIRNSQISISALTFNFLVVNGIQCSKNIPQRCSNVEPSIGFYSDEINVAPVRLDVNGTLLAPIRRPTFVVTNISGSTSAYGDFNHIYIAFVVNSALQRGTWITLEGFCDFQHFSDDLRLVGPSANYFAEGIGAWRAAEGVVALNLSNDVPEQAAVEIAFIMQNRLEKNKLCDVENQRIAILGESIQIDPTTLTGSPVGISNFSSTPTFYVSVCEELQRVPCSWNKLSFNLSANYKIMIGEEITISGILSGSTINDTLSVIGNSASCFNHTASWIPNAGQIILTTRVCTFEPGSSLEFSVMIRNPQRPQPACYPAVSTSVVPPVSLLDVYGSPASILSASEGPHLSVKLIISGQSTSFVDSLENLIFISVIANSTGASREYIYVDSIQDWAFLQRAGPDGTSTACLIEMRILAEAADNLSSLADTLEALVSSGNLTQASVAGGLTQILTISIAETPVLDLRTAFDVKVMESTSVQGAMNTITLSVHIAAFVAAGSVMYISDIPPTQSSSATVRLTGSGAKYFSHSESAPLPGTADYYAVNRVITFYVIEEIPPSDFDVAFALRNSAKRQDFPPIAVYIIDDIVVYGPDYSQITVLNSEIPVQLVFAKMIENSRSASYGNTLTIQLRPNGPLPIGTELTIYGLTGSQTESSPSLLLFGPNASLFGDSCSWFQDNGTLICAVMNGEVIPCGGGICENDLGVLADQTLEIAVDLINPATVRTARIPLLRGASQYFTIAPQSMYNLSCSFAWCGVKLWSEYLLLAATRCAGTVCVEQGMMQIDITGPEFLGPVEIVSSTDSSIQVSITISKVARAICMNTSFVPPNLSVAFKVLRGAATLLPDSAVPPNASNISLGDSPILQPFEKCTANLTGLDANTMYRIYCIAQDLELPPNRMTVEKVNRSGIIYATDVAMSGSCRSEGNMWIHHILLTVLVSLLSCWTRELRETTVLPISYMRFLSPYSRAR